VRERLPQDWADAVGGLLDEPWVGELDAWMDAERETSTVFPPQDRVFAALRLTPLANVRAVILGQDPYHGAGQAHGLAFSVPEGTPPPPSLRNIFRELQSDLGVAGPETGCLEPWARRGVLLLNTVLTVREGEAGSHRGRGWERLTDALIGAVSARPAAVVFLLWGNPARAKRALIDTDRHVVLESAHPSPLAAHRGFFGSRPFSRANEALISAGRPPIDWALGTAGAAP
jgi:uracil-DNA glycosylase